MYRLLLSWGLFVAASHQTGLDTRSKARRKIKVGIRAREGRERIETRTLLVNAAHRLTWCNVTHLLSLFVAASHQTGLDTRSKARRTIKVGIRAREGRERIETRTLLVNAAHRLTWCNVTHLLSLFVAASHQTGLDTRSKARRPIKVGIRVREGRERVETRTLLVNVAHQLTWCNVSLMRQAVSRTQMWVRARMPGYGLN